MKRVFTILLFICHIPLTFGQFQVKIGNDTTFCQCDYLNVDLAAHLSVVGGVPPYSYLWSGTIKEVESDAGIYYPVSYFLNDTEIANPKFIRWWDNGIWNRLKLTVTDALGNVAEDSINIRFSEYAVFGANEFPIYVNLGDSVFFDISGEDFGGILPYSYAWSPPANLSSPNMPQTWCKPEQENRYHCVLTDSVGCVGNVPYEWIIVRGTSITSVSNQGKVYQSGKTIYFDKLGNQEVLLQFYDLSGKFVAGYTTKSDSFSPDFGNDQKNSILLCKIMINNDQETIKYYMQ
jgi:hypothetical protein